MRFFLRVQNTRTRFKFFFRDREIKIKRKKMKEPCSNYHSTGWNIEKRVHENQICWYFFLMMMKATTMIMVFSVFKPKFLKRFCVCQQRNAISVQCDQIGIVCACTRVRKSEWICLIAVEKWKWRWKIFKMDWRVPIYLCVDHHRGPICKVCPNIR